MIITKIQGGLGNQMFQYAVGRSLAARHKTELVLDTSWYEGRKAVGDTSRPYKLDVFKTGGRQAGAPELKAIRLVESPKAWKRRVGRILWPSLPRLTPLWEAGHQFNEAFRTAPDNSYLAGWWQTEKYFTEVAQEIRSDFAFRDEPDETNRKMLEQIKTGTAVSLHVRRGDYVTNTNANAFHGLAGLAYYEAAIARIAEKVSSPSFYVFSDDPEWCKANLKIAFPTTYVEHNTKDEEDIRLMSQCRHHIIANSSFSWWGAWLNPREDKIVIGPKQWFQDTSVNTSDILAESWTKL